jgi:VanZ family protein
MASPQWRTRVQVPARLAYLLVLLIATLTPFEADPSGTNVVGRLANLLHPGVAGRDIIDGARNLVLFGGWGVVWALTAAGKVRRIALQATLTGAAISALVETAQLFSSNRNASLLDLATNTGGSLVGAVVLLALVALALDQRGARSYVGIPALLFAGSYGMATWLEAVIPLFRQDSVPGAYGWPSRRLLASLAAFRWASIASFSWSDLPLFVPAGAFAVMALAEHRVPYPAGFRRTALAGLSLAALAELLHGCLGQPMLLGAVLVHAATVAAGGWIASRTLPGLSVALRGSARPRALIVAYVLVLMAWAWRPFLPELDAGAMQAKLALPWYIPLAGLGGRVDFFSVVDVCAPFFLYLPLGALLAVWPLRRHGLLAGPWPGIWLAFMLEAGQLVLPDRTLDITDVLVQASGAAIGWAIVRRAGYQVHGEVFGATRTRAGAR